MSRMMNDACSDMMMKRTHIGVAPTNQMHSPYSDNVDNSDNSASPSFDDGNRANLRFFDIDVDGDRAVHDQLPSVEEAKASSNFDGLTRQNRRNKRRKLYWILYGIVVVVVIAIVSFAMWERFQYDFAVASVTTTVRLSHPDDFLDSKSPQSMALRWMLHEDSLQLPLPDKRSDPFVQRYLVAVLVFALTTDTTMTSLSMVMSSKKSTRDVFGLLSGVHECEWNSKWDKVNHDGKTGDIMVTAFVRLGIICGSDNDIWINDGVSNDRVTDILFPRSGLQGELPPELEALNHLTRVDLDNNKIDGRVPPMPYVKELSLAYNQLTGFLPDHFSEMTRLRTLSMSENSLQGSLPHKFAALTDLTILALNGNQLTGTLEEIYSLTNLEELYLANNSFNDQLSNGSFKELLDLKVIDAKNNRLSGPLPNALWKLTRLEVIDFHKNALDGHINNVIVENHPLKYLDVSSNILGGGFPTTISNLSSLTHLDVSYNRFDTRLNTHLAGMTKMRTLLLTEEDGLGPQPLPDWLRGMTDLENLSFRLATRTGTIPTWFGELTHLKLLDLDWNHISGSVPTELSRLTNLKYLMLNRNRLTGTVPTAVSSLPHLKVLMLDTNSFDRVVLTGDEDICTEIGGRIEHLIADCGRMESRVRVEQEVECPCCTNCCWDSAERCNMKDWIIELEEEYRGNYDRYEYEFDDTWYTSPEA